MSPFFTVELQKGDDTMIIERIHPFTGKLNAMELPVTKEQLQRWRDGELIQRAMPNLTPDEREFIKTGLTEEHWSSKMVRTGFK